MSRKLFIGGNWKMNTDRDSAASLASGLVEAIGSVEEIDVAVAPPSVYLSAVGEVLKGSNISLAGQNCWYEPNGAYTGEISTDMLLDVGCDLVILGHSERRHVLGETDELINRKVLKALDAGLDVILCVGELLEQRQAGQTNDVVTRQVKIGMEGVPSSFSEKGEKGKKGLPERLTIAYEPVWAIGTGVTATPEQAQEVHAMIRSLLADMYDRQIADGLRIQYGGSMKPDNAAELFAKDDIDGGLIGGASLKVEDFASIIKAGM